MSTPLSLPPIDPTILTILTTTFPPPSTPTISQITELPNTHLHALLLLTFLLHPPLILKLPPPTQVRLLRLDTSLSTAEVSLLALIQSSPSLTSLPIPALISHSPFLPALSSPWLLLSHLPGTPLANESTPSSTLRQTGTNLQKIIDAITPPDPTRFGRLIHGSSNYTTWTTCFTALFHSLLLDGEEAQIQLPYDHIRKFLKNPRIRAALDEITEAKLTLPGFGLRKVLVRDDGSVSGMILGAGRALWGDPMMCQAWRGWRGERSGREWEVLVGFSGGEERVEGFVGVEKGRVRLLMYEAFHCVVAVLERYYYDVRVEEEMEERRKLVKCLEDLERLGGGGG